MNRSRKILIGVAVLALVALPVSNVVANHYFDDVPTSAFYHSSVTALANAEITGGCNQAGTLYCPNNAVTRGQMAVFLDRIANLRNEKGPVVDALTVFGQATVYDSETFNLPGTPGVATECRESTNPVPPGSLLPYLLTAQLSDAPADTSTINVSVDDPDLEDEVFDVCFTIIGGTALPAGDYDTVLGLSLNIGSGLFASAGARHEVTNLIKSWRD